jgi:hypothetical protein
LDVGGLGDGKSVRGGWLHPGRIRGAVTAPVALLFQRLRFFFALLAVIAGLPGCGVLHWPLWKKRPPRAIAKTSQMIGTVALVSEEPSFVLIDNGSLPAPAVGTVLTIIRPGGTPVEMKVTAIRKPPFVVADIVKGMPKKGEEVFQ